MEKYFLFSQTVEFSLLAADHPTVPSGQFTDIKK